MQNCNYGCNLCLKTWETAGGVVPPRPGYIYLAFGWARCDCNSESKTNLVPEIKDGELEIKNVRTEIKDWAPESKDLNSKLDFSKGIFTPKTSLILKILFSGNIEETLNNLVWEHKFLDVAYDFIKKTTNPDIEHPKSWIYDLSLPKEILDENLNGLKALLALICISNNSFYYEIVDDYQDKINYLFKIVIENTKCLERLLTDGSFPKNASKNLQDQRKLVIEGLQAFLQEARESKSSIYYIGDRQNKSRNKRSTPAVGDILTIHKLLKYLEFKNYNKSDNWMIELLGSNALVTYSDPNSFILVGYNSDLDLSDLCQDRYGFSCYSSSYTPFSFDEKIFSLASDEKVLVLGTPDCVVGSENWIDVVKSKNLKIREYFHILDKYYFFDGLNHP